MIALGSGPGYRPVMAKSVSRRRPRKRLCPPPPGCSRRIYVQVKPSDIGLFRFLLEAWDNLGVFTVADKFRGVLQLRYSPHQEREMRQFLDAASHEMTVQEIPFPLTP